MTITRVADSLGEYELGAANAETGWIRGDASIDDITFNITGTWSGAIALQVSNQAAETKTRYSTIASYTANQPPLGLPREIGRFFRLIMTSYSSGAAYVGLSRGRQPSGESFDLSPQGNTNSPSGQHA